MAAEGVHRNGSLTPTPGLKPVVAVAVAGIVLGGAAEWAFFRSGVGIADLVRDLSVGWAFIGSGLLAWWRRPANRTGRLMVAVGFTWFVGNFEALGAPVVFALAYWLSSLNQAVLAHLILAFPTGRLTSRPAQFAVAAAYAEVGTVGLLRMLANDPTSGDPQEYLCGRNCPPNAMLLVHSPTFFNLVDHVNFALGAAIGLAVLLLLIQRWRRATPAQRRVALQVWVSGILLALVILSDATVAIIGEGAAPHEGVFIWLSDLSQLAIPLAFPFGLLLNQLARGGVGELVIELGHAAAPAQLREVLARTLADPSLELAFWLPEAGGYVTAEGRQVSLPAADEPRAVTLVERRGRPLAAIVHDPALADDSRLVEAVRAAAALGLENERLHAELRAHVEEVRASRVRILEAADAERRRIERNLHDGAQQRLLSVGLDLRLAATQAQRSAEPELMETVARARRDLQQAVGDLRELARGIHPPILLQGGLAPAVASLLESAPVPVTVAIKVPRYPILIESTAYYAVSEAVANAVKHADASAIQVAAREREGRLLVEVTDDGRGGAEIGRGVGLQSLADRAVALGGRLEVHSRSGAGTRLVVELPLPGADAGPAAAPEPEAESG